MRSRKGLSSYTDSNGSVNYKLYNTIILTFNNENEIILNSGGFKTNHTKNCMNDHLPSGFRIYQRNFDWFVETPQGTFDFEDGFKIRLGD